MESRRSRPAGGRERRPEEEVERMPPDLLLEELKAAAPIPVDFDGLEQQGAMLLRLLRLYLNQVSAAVEGMKGSAAGFESIWRRIVRDVAKGRTAEMQAARPGLLTALENRLDRLKRAHALAEQLRNSHGSEAVPDPDALLPEIAGLERLKTEVFDRWQTQEDLEDLVAESLAPSPEKLEAVARKYGGPSQWHRQEAERP
jgi:hypothetical protein